jgi:hypothetical protein
LTQRNASRRPRRRGQILLAFTANTDEEQNGTVE